jgi:hypothetical protein
MTTSGNDPRPVGILVNPSSGRDVRRIAARASVSTLETKRDQVARAVVGAAASGASKILVVRDLMRIAERAVENLRIHADIEIVIVETCYKARDTELAAEALRRAGCGAIVLFGGDGTSRVFAKAWSDAPLVPLSTGTNNVFPMMIEAGIAGAAAGLVASGGVTTLEVAPRAKVVRVEIDGEKDDLALVDAVLLVDDSVGNLMPYDAKLIRKAVLARAEPAAVGISPLGGLLMPSGADDDFGVAVTCAAADESGGRAILVPISPGLYRSVRVTDTVRLELGESITVEGPGVLAFDGDRERALAAGQTARLRVVRDGPRVIDVPKTLRLAAERGLYLDIDHFHDPLAEGGVKFDCC